MNLEKNQITADLFNCQAELQHTQAKWQEDKKERELI
jgi:hypothetical protein